MLAISISRESPDWMIVFGLNVQILEMHVQVGEVTLFLVVHILQLFVPLGTFKSD